MYKVLRAVKDKIPIKCEGVYKISFRGKVLYCTNKK